MTAPTVALIINNYNLDRYLEAALLSAFDQSDAPDEIIVVDDGSTDGSRDILHRWRDRVRVHHQRNQGQAAALNAGFARATSDVIVFLDADDLLLPRAVEAIRQHWTPDLAKLHWPLRVIDDAGQSTERLAPSSRLPRGDLSALLLTEGPSAVVLMSPPTSGNAWSRAKLRDVMPMDNVRWRAWPDTYLLTLAPLLGDVGACDEALGCYRVHGHNVSLSGGPTGQLARAVAYVRESGQLLSEMRPDVVSAELATSWVTDSWAGRLQQLWALIIAEVPAGLPFLLHDDWQTGWVEVDGRPVVRPGETRQRAAYEAVPWWQDSPEDRLGGNNAGGFVGPIVSAG